MLIGGGVVAERDGRGDALLEQFDARPQAVAEIVNGHRSALVAAQSGRTWLTSSAVTTHPRTALSATVTMRSDNGTRPQEQSGTGPLVRYVNGSRVAHVVTSSVQNFRMA